MLFNFSRQGFCVSRGASNPVIVFFARLDRQNASVRICGLPYIIPTLKFDLVLLQLLVLVMVNAMGLQGFQYANNAGTRVILLEQYGRN